MLGPTVRAARKAAGWSQPQLAEQAGLTHREVALIERGTRLAKPEESEALKSAFKQALGEVLIEGEDAPVDSSDHAMPPCQTIEMMGRTVTRSTEWRGLRRGDPCRIAGEKGLFRFLLHHAEDCQEYAQLFGPSKSPQLRSIQPDRVRDARGRQLKENDQR